MTWNVENLFRPAEGAPADAQKAYETKLAGLGALITSQSPDIVALQEAGSLEAVQDLTRAVGGNWHIALSAFPDDRGIRVGFISRLSFVATDDILEPPAAPFPRQQINDGPVFMERMGRGALAVTVQSGSGPITLVTTHLKSKLLSFPGGRFSPRDEFERNRFEVYALNRRAVEAATVRAYCNSLLQGEGTSRHLVVLGDLNDGPDAQTTKLLYGPGGSQPGSRGAERPDKGDGERLFNLAALLPADEQRTRVYQGRGEIIDHILVSRSMLGRLEQGSVRAPTARDLPSVTDLPSERPPGEASDHAAVVASFDI